VANSPKKEITDIKDTQRIFFMKKKQNQPSQKCSGYQSGALKTLGVNQISASATGFTKMFVYQR
jgi:hypothetical protein